VSRLAIGPVRDFPSWTWIGADTARELAKYAEVVPFESYRRIPPCDAVMAIKQRPPLRLGRKLHDRDAKLIYAPVDRYAAIDEIYQDRPLLEACDLVLAHSELLLECLRPHCRRLALVEHHGKYTLPELAPYKEEGHVLWVGGLQHTPYLIDWLERYPIRRRLSILTDVGNREAADAARRLARRLGVRLSIEPDSINGHAAHVWSEAEQRRMMQACKAAIDIKGEDFTQSTKPPVKAQKFISSGIPFACNAETSASRYFRDRGFELASPLDEETWFSRDYWQRTQGVGAELRDRIAIETVGLSYWAELRPLLYPGQS